MNFVEIVPPVDAFIHSTVYSRYGEVFRRMGVKKQTFRVIAVAADDSTVVIHPDDIGKPSTNLTTIRRDSVGFVNPDEAAARGVKIR